MPFFQARLYIDGKQFVETRHNPMIIDNWPLHPAKSSHSARFAIGACWHGIEWHLLIK